MKTTQQWQDRLGYYLVGNKKFFNKSLALIEHSVTREPITWIFNDSAYGAINWTIPIETSLTELYRQRAQQLRNEYDYLVLYFSGGADSTNVLHAFVDNNIFLDEIVVQYPGPVEQTFNNQDKTAGNYYSEIQFSAIPILNKLKNKLHPATKFRHQDIAKPVIELLQNDNWFESNQMGTNITIAGIARQAAQVTEPHILELCNKGKQVAQILGIDKPLVTLNGEDYYAHFLDVSAMHAPPVDLSQLEIYEKFYHAEFFYWTPNMPEIVVKQAQEIKKMCQNNSYTKSMIKQSQHIHVGALRPVLHPIIYPTIGKIEFEADKPESKLIRVQDRWFWSTADARIKDNYLSVIKYLRSKTESYDMNNNDIMNGFNGTNSKFYKL